jgi:hypothetical protein
VINSRKYLRRGRSRSLRFFGLRQLWQMSKYAARYLRREKQRIFGAGPPKKVFTFFLRYAKMYFGGDWVSVQSRDLPENV